MASGARTDLSVILIPVGYGTATRVKIFRDVLPWDFTSTDTVLMNMGFTQGAGSNQYQIIASSLMGSVTLTPGTDLIIIEADQETLFYQNYISASATFEEFVEQGGTMFFIAALQTSTLNAVDLVLPNSVTIYQNPNNYNYTLIDDHPLMANMGDTIRGSSASHGSLLNLPEAALRLTIDEDDSVTLAIYGYGQGTVIVSGQPLEHMRYYRLSYPEGGSILSRVIHYALGYDPTPEPTPRVGNLPNAIPSSSER